MTGYCLFIIGKVPTYRIVFKQSLQEALKAVPKLREESGGRVEVLRMIDGDTKIIESREEYDEFTKS